MSSHFKTHRLLSVQANSRDSPEADDVAEDNKAANERRKLFSQAATDEDESPVFVDTVVRDDLIFKRRVDSNDDDVFYDGSIDANEVCVPPPATGCQKTSGLTLSHRWTANNHHTSANSRHPAKSLHRNDLVKSRSLHEHQSPLGNETRCYITNNELSANSRSKIKRSLLQDNKDTSRVVFGLFDNNGDKKCANGCHHSSAKSSNNGVFDHGRRPRDSIRAGLENVAVEFRGFPRNRPLLRTSASVAYDNTGNGAKGKLGRDDNRSHSLEVPCISINIEDLTTPPNETSQKGQYKSHTNCSVGCQRSPEQFNNACCVCHDVVDESLSNNNTTLPVNYSDSLLQNKSFGRSVGNKLKTAYSLDVPGHDSMKLSLSLGTLDPNQQKLQKDKFQIVEDKLISSSMPRLDRTPSQTRRLSWAPGNVARGSRGSIVSKCSDSNNKVGWLQRKGRSLSEHHSSTPTLDALVCGVTMAASYERFDTNGPISTGVPEEKTMTSPTSENETGGLKDTQIEIDREDGQVTFHAADQSKGGTEYIADPAGDPFLPKSGLEKARANVQKIVDNFYFRLLTVTVILTDFILVIVDLALYACAGNDSALEIISHIFIIFFIFEVSGRVFYRGKKFFKNWLDVLDLGVVLMSFIVDVIFMALAANGCPGGGRYAQLVVIGRVVRIIRVVRIVYFMIVQHRQVARATRQMVSQNKRRYEKDGFDLDLCYITERVIAMSFPSKGLMALYRNPVAEVARFFNTKHKGHYRIYNLCSERDYNETLFFNNVERVFIDDHNVPKLREMLDFTANAREWMAADKQNVIAIHCKGGKGRTGAMICTWLIDCGLLESAQESLQYFGDRRTDLSKGSTFQGVETPSQSRYVQYYERLKNGFNRQLPPKKVLKLVSMKITGINSVGNGDGSELFMELRQDGLPIYECNLGTKVNCEVEKFPNDDVLLIKLQNSPSIHGDIKIMFKTHSKQIPIGYDKCPFYFWFYTSFIEDNQLYIPRDELDNPHKKKTHHVFRENFGIELRFQDVEEM